MGRPAGENPGFQEQLILKQLDRIDDELMQLERDVIKISLAADQKDSKPLEATRQRLEEMTKRRVVLQKDLERRIEKSVDLETRGQELRQLQAIANDMSTKLEQMDINAQAPARIRQLSPATINSKQIARQ
jgi:hypothetical protein